MVITDKLDVTIGGWLKSVPHLPENAKKWLCDNIWWIVLIGVIGAGIGCLFMIGTIITTISLLEKFSLIGYYYAAGYTHSGWPIVTASVSLIFTIIMIIFIARSVKPLRAKEGHGWRMLFYAMSIQAVAMVIESILALNIVEIIFSLIFGAIGIAVGFYLLYEVRPCFIGEKKAEASPAAEQKTETENKPSEQ